MLWGFLGVKVWLGEGQNGEKVLHFCASGLGLVGTSAGLFTKIDELEDLSSIFLRQIDDKDVR